MAAEPEATLDDPPIDAVTLRAARRFLALIGERYPVREAYLFGSRARGTHRPDSDADVAVVLRGERGNRGAVVIDMAGVAFDVMMDLTLQLRFSDVFPHGSAWGGGTGWWHRLRRRLSCGPRRCGT